MSETTCARCHEGPIARHGGNFVKITMGEYVHASFTICAYFQARQRKIEEMGADDAQKKLMAEAMAKVKNEERAKPLYRRVLDALR